jgi:hypothetical protein
MAIVMTLGKVSTYNSSTGKLVCIRTGGYVWLGNKVRTSGTNPSICNPNTFIFDVTVSAATAALLVPNYVFQLEYDDSVIGSYKPVTKFAGEIIQSSLASAALQTLRAANSPSSLPPPA